MKLELHTWRYGSETSLLFHGKHALTDDTSIDVLQPVLPDGKIGMRQVILLTPGDDYVVFRCDESCALHFESDQK